MSDKPRLDREFLEQHGVTYSEDVFSPLATNRPRNGERVSPLPDHVESLRQALLDFGAAIPESLKPFFKKERQTFRGYGADEDDVCNNVDPPASVYFPVPNPPTKATAKEIEVAENTFEENQKLAERSREYTAANVSEATWEHFLHAHVFKSFEDTNMSRKKHDYLFDAWYLESNLHWNEAKIFRNFDPSITQPTGPKPDLTYGIPINGPHDDLTPGFRDHESVTNFSIKVLGELLQSKGLVSSPVSGVSEWTKKTDHKLSQSHLVCFPWALVELKPVKEEENPVQFCYCQAANGASAALTLLESLYMRASLATIDYVERIPPVIAFTCIGPEIRVWLAFAEIKQSKPVAHKMVCIWASTLNATWGVIATRQIVKNMVFWASRFLRPQISSCISQIRFPAPNPYLHNRRLTRRMIRVRLPKVDHGKSDSMKAEDFSDNQRPFAKFVLAAHPRNDDWGPSGLFANLDKGEQESRVDRDKPDPSSSLFSTGKPPFGSPGSLFGVGKPLFGDKLLHSGSSKGLFGSMSEQESRVDRDKPDPGNGLFGTGKPLFGDNQLHSGSPKGLFGNKSEQESRVERDKPGPSSSLFRRGNPPSGTPSSLFGAGKPLFSDNQLRSGSPKGLFSNRSEQESRVDRDSPDPSSSLFSAGNPLFSRPSSPKLSLQDNLFPLDKTSPGLGDNHLYPGSPKGLFGSMSEQESRVDSDKPDPSNSLFGTGQPLFGDNLLHSGSPKGLFGKSEQESRIDRDNADPSSSLFSAGNPLFSRRTSPKLSLQDNPFPPDKTSPVLGDNHLHPGSSEGFFGNGPNQPTSSKEKPFSLEKAVNNSSNDSNPEDRTLQDNPPIPTLFPGYPDTRYFMYKTAESPTSGGYDAAAWWDSDDDDSYQSFSESVVEHGDSEMLQLSPSTGSDDADVEEGSSSDVHATDSEDDIGCSEKKNQDPCRGVNFSSVPRGTRAVLTQGDIDGLMSQAVKSLSGKEFVALKVITSLIVDLTGIPLLDATWRALEVWEGHDHRPGELEIRLDYALIAIHTALAMQNEIVIEKIQPQHIIRGERWEDLDHALRAVQRVSEMQLRVVLCLALRCWGGEKCLEILHAEIEKLAPEKVKSMQREALDVLQSDAELKLHDRSL